jgi:hypothetical protein
MTKEAPEWELANVFVYVATDPSVKVTLALGRHFSNTLAQTIMDREPGEDTARYVLKTVVLSLSFKKRNLLANSQLCILHDYAFALMDASLDESLGDFRNTPLHPLFKILHGNSPPAARLLNPSPQLLSGVLDLALLRRRKREMLEAA